MRKILTKTITSILICLSLAFSSIGFLPMSAFATSGGAGMENLPVNLEFKEGCTPPTYLKLKLGEESEESYDFNNAVALGVGESLSVSSNKEEIVSVYDTTIKAAAPGVATITVEKCKNEEVLAVAEVEIMVPRFVGSIIVDSGSINLNGTFYDENVEEQLVDGKVDFKEGAKICGNVDVSALVEEVVDEYGVVRFNIKDTVLLEGESEITSGTLNVRSSGTLYVQSGGELYVSGTLNVRSSGTLNVRSIGTLNVYRDAKINQHTFNEDTEIKKTNITANDYQS